MTTTGLAPSSAPAEALREISALGLRRDDLTSQKAAAENRFLQSIAAAYKSGALAMDDLAERYYDYREIADPGYSYLWDLAVPVTAARIVGYARSRPFRQPNGPGGSWHGPYPFDDGPTPGLGTPVVYLLFDHLATICYIGSTGTFRTRINRHAGDGKQFVRWEALPCPGRREAFDLEYQLIREHQPYLNSSGRN